MIINYNSAIDIISTNLTKERGGYCPFAEPQQLKVPLQHASRHPFIPSPFASILIPSSVSVNFISHMSFSIIFPPVFVAFDYWMPNI